MNNKGTYRKGYKIEPGHIDAMHPLALFLFFLYVLFFTMFTINPVLLIISFLLSIVSVIIICGLRALAASVKFVVPVMLLTIIINPLFNHRGRTLLLTFPTGNVLTLESMVYGVFSGVLFAAIILWFIVFNRVFASDKVLYILGRVSPSLSLVLSMTLRFVPEFREKAGQIIGAQKMLLPEPKTIMGKVRFYATVMSGLVSWSIEHSVLKAFSMKNRSYGSVKRRTSYHLFSIKVKDVISIVASTIFIVVLVVLNIKGAFDYWFYPTFYGELFAVNSLIGYLVFALLCVIIIIDSYKIKRYISLNDMNATFMNAADPSGEKTGGEEDNDNN